MKTPTSPTDRRGFTLVEMAVVVLIVGILSGLVFSRLDALIPGERLRSAAADMVGAARLARAAARARRMEVILEYDLDENAWSVSGFFGEADEELEGAALLVEGENIPDEPEVIFSRKLAEGLNIAEVRYGESGIASTGKVAASFAPSGSVGEHMVLIVSDSGFRAAVFVPALTGSAFLVEDDASYAEIRSRRRQE